MKKFLLVIIAAMLLVATVSGATWSVRNGHSSVTMADGSIILTGGGPGGWANMVPDTWRSTDGGSTWTLMNVSSGWIKRSGHVSVALPDGSIVLMGGTIDGGIEANDTWRSTDNGATWVEMNSSSGWSARTDFVGVALSDGSIVIMGGLNAVRLNDVWRSTDNGATWIRQTAAAGWTARPYFAAVAMSDDDIVIMGGSTALGCVNDTWRSQDNGATWVELNADSGWESRDGHISVVLPDDTIILAGGSDCSGGAILRNDVWESIDDGATWTQTNVGAEWPTRFLFSGAPLPDNSVVIMGGAYAGGNLNDTWRSYDYGATWFRSPWEREVIFTGNVNDAETGLPINGAVVVTTQGANVSTTTTGASGAYNTSGILFLTSKSLSFAVGAFGYSSYGVSLVPLFSKTVVLNFTLNSTTPSYTGLAFGGVARDGVLTGNVITKGYGRPIQGATVYVVNNTNYEVHTKTTSMTGWYLCDEGSSCYLINKRPYSLWGNKTGYHDSPEYIRSVAP